MCSARPEPTHDGVKRVAIVCTGSRGDCQPFVALAIALQKLHLRVRMYAPAEMQSWCAAFFESKSEELPVVDFFPLPHLQIQTFLLEDQVARDAMSQGNFLTFLRAASQEKFLKMQTHDTRILIEDLREHFQPEHVVYNTVASMQGAAIAQLFGITSTSISMQMMIETSAIEPNMLISPKLAASLPCLCRLMWHVQLCLMAWSPLVSYMQKHYLIPELGFRKWTNAEVVAIFQGLGDGCTPIVARSPLLSPPPADWSEQARSRVLGAMVLPAEEQVRKWPPSDELLAFLSKENDRPVYLGWGSMIAIRC